MHFGLKEYWTPYKKTLSRKYMDRVQKRVSFVQYEKVGKNAFNGRKRENTTKKRNALKFSMIERKQFN